MHDPCSRLAPLGWGKPPAASAGSEMSVTATVGCASELHWKHSQQGTGAGGNKSVVVCMGSLDSLGSREGFWHCSSCQQSAVLDQEKERPQLVMGPGPQQYPVRWCSLCRAWNVVPPLHCPSQFSGPWCCTWGAGTPCREYFCLPQPKEEFVGLGNGSVPIPPSPATVPVMGEGAPDVAKEFVQRWFLQVRLLQGG